MRTFYCDHCGGLVFFENVSCLRCGHALGFLPDALDVSALVPTVGNQWKPLSAEVNGLYRLCENGQVHSICNWLVPVGDENPLCTSCRLTIVVPDLSILGNRERWHRLEVAKRRLIYTLLALRLPFRPAPEPASQPSPLAPLRFQFIADMAVPVTTGHAGGLITVSLAEADDDIRERRRLGLHEPFRTLLGHFRHEIGHYYWDALIAGSPRLDRFRELFGDERNNYAEALQRHYKCGPPSDWAAHTVSAYATAHPWEDWAETWAHYLHIVDTLETAAGFGLRLQPKHPAKETMQADPVRVTGRDGNFDSIISVWFSLTYALNSLNRGMGLPDLYPFVLSPEALEKLRFVYDTIEAVKALKGQTRA